MIYTQLAAAIVSVGLGFAGGIWSHIKLDDAAELKRVRAEAIRQEAQARTTHALMETRDAEIRAVNDRLADALERLRNRPALRLAETPASCAGSSPAALSAADAGVAVRLAAEAEQLRADYSTCREWAESVTK